ncbi:hypothetical protein AFLA70_332g001040 [Aspergillus flavus AF70]|nr:hypothetical protein AFLA70_332g001040 [Aspergillus flavus AF70]
MEKYGPHMCTEGDGAKDTSFAAGVKSGSQLRRGRCANGSHSAGLYRKVSQKRKREEDPLDPALMSCIGPSSIQPQQGLVLLPTQKSHQYPQHEINRRESATRPQVPLKSLPETCAVAVNSTLLPRTPSGKKPSWLPVAELLSSLGLSQESSGLFRLAATEYMLDSGHPERLECVGQRRRGSLDMAKLHLLRCARHFLDAEGYGDRFFGENAIHHGMNPRSQVWPRDQEKRITLVSPLLKNIVTNEQQRQYNNGKRKQPEGLRHQANDSLQLMRRFSPVPPLSPTAKSQNISSCHSFQPALTDLALLDCTTDHGSVTQKYDLYNHEYALDDLWFISGLQRLDWQGLVAAVDSHYQICHTADYECPKSCDNLNILRIIQSDSASKLCWRVGGYRNLPAANEFASSIIRDSIAAGRNSHTSPPR